MSKLVTTISGRSNAATTGFSTSTTTTLFLWSSISFEAPLSPTYVHTRPTTLHILLLASLPSSMTTTPGLMTVPSSLIALSSSKAFFHTTHGTIVYRILDSVETTLPGESPTLQQVGPASFHAEDSACELCTRLVAGVE